MKQHDSQYRALPFLSLFALACLPVGALGTKLGVWPFTIGGMVILLGALVAAVVLLTSLVRLLRSHRRGVDTNRGRLWLSALVASATVGIVGVQLAPAATHPRIHNITTDPVDPPAFDKIVPLRGDSNPHTYDEALAEIQQNAYPHIQTLKLDLPPSEVFDRAVGVVNELGLELVDADAAAGTIEATDTSFWFGFKDDVVIRVRGTGGSAVVDVRSVSRVGQSDLGANAARIETILERLRKR